MLNESVSFNDPNINIIADFQLIQNGQTTRAVGHITTNTTTKAVTVSVTLSVDGHPVASISADPATAQWVDAGGQPLTAADLPPLRALLNAFPHFADTVSS